jgi:tetratricopeptide (TPR) repeat protein
VLLQHPTDRDTRAFFALVKALHKKEVTPMDQLKELGPGFQFEADLWIQQGLLRLTATADFPDALRCFTAAWRSIDKEELRSSGILAAAAAAGQPAASISALLSNMAVLNHSLGKKDEALGLSRRALMVAEEYFLAKKVDSAPPPSGTTIFRNSELEGLFYSWSQPIGHVTVIENGLFSVCDSSLSLLDFLEVGDDVMIGDVIHQVDAVVGDGQFGANSAIKLAAVSHAGNAEDPTRCVAIQYEIRKRLRTHNFCDETITLCYNHARLLEDSGHLKAAAEIYVALLKLHPSFMEC